MGLNCPFFVHGETLEEVSKQALTHVIEVHTMDFNNIQTPDEIIRMEKALAHSTCIIPG
jgi:predicted small metal-binding protein